ncbi:hypothetical protein FRC12_001483 [Ceratobasidium sp. 428]|nr:hypothetical protein FRC12_001483 [Ceratobasidium sp. 428]
MPEAWNGKSSDSIETVNNPLETWESLSKGPFVGRLRDSSTPNTLVVHRLSPGLFCSRKNSAPVCPDGELEPERLRRGSLNRPSWAGGVVRGGPARNASPPNAVEGAVELLAPMPREFELLHGGANGARAERLF